MSRSNSSANRRRAVVNKPAFERGELLSAEHSPDVLAARRARTYDGPVGELNRWVDTVRARTGESVPHLDPAAASEGVRVLVLLQDPSRVADTGSGFISRHNDDATARNTYLAAERAGLRHEESLHWNVVPWWVDNPARQVTGRPRTLAGEARRARPYLLEFVRLLPQRPAAIVLGGRQAQAAWRALVESGSTTALDGVPVLACPHPSPQVFPKKCAAGVLNGDVTTAVFRRAAELIRSWSPAPARGFPTAGDAAAREQP